MKRIRKTYNGVVPNGKLLNSYSTSQNDGYNCKYINDLETYSTEEQRIGTWLGKPLYRKVIDYVPSATMGALNATTNVIIYHNISNLGQLVDAKIVSENNVIFPNLTGNTSGDNIVKYAGLVQADSSTGYIVFRIVNDTWGVRHYYVTLEYTKTTD